MLVLVIHSTNLTNPDNSDSKQSAQNFSESFKNTETLDTAQTGNVMVSNGSPQIIEKQRTILILSTDSNHATPQLSYTSTQAPVIWYNGEPRQAINDQHMISDAELRKAVDEVISKGSSNPPIDHVVDKLIEQHKHKRKPEAPHDDKPIAIF